MSDIMVYSAERARQFPDQEKFFQILRDFQSNHPELKVIAEDSHMLYLEFSIKAMIGEKKFQTPYYMVDMEAMHPEHFRVFVEDNYKDLKNTIGKHVLSDTDWTEGVIL